MTDYGFHECRTGKNRRVFHEKTGFDSNIRIWPCGPGSLILTGNIPSEDFRPLVMTLPFCRLNSAGWHSASVGAYEEMPGEEGYRPICSA
jgi:hypothetical protein